MSDEWILKPVGFFADSPYGEFRTENAKDLSNQKEHPEKQKIISYLENAYCIAALGGPVKDCIDPSAGYAHTYHIHTDGTWVWPSGYAYYVKKYNVTVPATFLEFMENMRWTPPLIAVDAETPLCEALHATHRKFSGSKDSV